MDQPMTREESYAERRRLFKNIWETAMHIDDKECDILNKPKVIKTLRLAEVDRSAGKKKKQRIKNLRSVCNKLLDFCDRQDADDLFYENLIAEGQEVPPHTDEINATTLKSGRVRKKKRLNKKSLSAPVDINVPRNSVSERKNNKVIKRSMSPIKAKFGKKLTPEKTIIAGSSSPIPRKINRVIINNMTEDPNPARRKIIKIKSSKRKTTSNNFSPTSPAQ